jgi:hypothetical protein
LQEKFISHDNSTKQKPYKYFMDEVEEERAKRTVAAVEAEEKVGEAESKKDIEIKRFELFDIKGKKFEM